MLHVAEVAEVNLEVRVVNEQGILTLQKIRVVAASSVAESKHRLRASKVDDWHKQALH